MCTPITDIKCKKSSFDLSFRVKEKCIARYTLFTFCKIFKPRVKISTQTIDITRACLIRGIIISASLENGASVFQKNIGKKKNALDWRATASSGR